MRPDNRKQHKLRRADATPFASALIEGLRDVGYSLETALADIIDNAITAGARSVNMLSQVDAGEPTIGVLDDGCGMSEQELIDAMRPGSRNPLDTRKRKDLGRFGLGLKSASFSQCRQLTVVTRKNGVTSGAVWDLDRVADTNRWEIEILESTNEVPWADKLGVSGTLVIWQKLDRISNGYQDNAPQQAAVVNQKLAAAERHIRLVFHKFIKPSGIKLFLNGRLLEPLDPFALKHRGTIADPEDILHLAGEQVVIQSVTLPHHKQMSQSEWNELGGPEGHLRSQGFYLYRESRLIIHGTWLGLCRQSELTKLCRVRIEIPNTMDAAWNIDIKKSSAQLPPAVRERLKRVLERISQGSRRTYQRRGQRLVDQARWPLWHRVNVGDSISYRPNPAHPAILEFAEMLSPDLRTRFDNCVLLIGAALPLEALHADMAGAAERVVVDTVDSSVLVQAVQATMDRLTRKGLEPQAIELMLKDIEPFRSSWDATRSIIDDWLAENRGENVGGPQT